MIDDIDIDINDDLFLTVKKVDYQSQDKSEKSLSTQINDIIVFCKEIYDTLGCGLSEAIYHKALYNELIDNNYRCEFKKIIPVYFKGLNVGYLESDIVITLNNNECLILELKTIQNLTKKEESQIKSYIKHIGKFQKKTGLLINFPLYSKNDLNEIQYKIIN
tara:strand:- start:165 stop:650 length:486 start_codon:yes stop_codon:yes gene_type:complete